MRDPSVQRWPRLPRAASYRAPHGPSIRLGGGGRRCAALTRLRQNRHGVEEISQALNGLLADVFALYLKNFYWHVSGPHFRDYHLLLDEQAEQIFATTDELAERVRKIGQPTLRSIGDISRQQRLSDNDAAYVEPQDMLAELQIGRASCREGV